MMRKLSKRQARNGILWLLEKNQQRDTSRVSKSLGLLLDPNMSPTACNTHLPVDAKEQPEVRVGRYIFQSTEVHFKGP